MIFHSINLKISSSRLGWMLHLISDTIEPELKYAMSSKWLCCEGNNPYPHCVPTPYLQWGLGGGVLSSLYKRIVNIDIIIT